MSRIRRTRNLLTVSLCLAAFFAAPAAAVDHTLEIPLDFDDSTATGCDFAGPGGTFLGAEALLVAAIETTETTATVVQVSWRDCVTPETDTFGPANPIDGGWPVGLGLGVDGFDVVELAFPLSIAMPPDPTQVKMAVFLSNALGDEGDLLETSPGSGVEPVLVLLDVLFPIPTLSEWALILFGLLLASLAFLLLRRPGLVAFLFAVVLLSGAGVAWAVCTLDGDPSEWDFDDLLAENPGAAGPAEIRALFAELCPDSDEVCLRADVEVVLEDPNQPPVAVDDAFTTDEDTMLVGENVLADNGSGADSDPEADPLTVTAFDAVSSEGAAVTVAANGDLTYDPTGAADLQALAAGDSVDDTFTYTIEDPSGGSDSATVTVTVDGVNDAPTAMDDEYETDEDVTLNIPAPGVLVNDDDVDTGDSITAVLDSGPTSADSFTLNPDGSFSYTPDLDFNGTDTFTYHAFDGTASSATVTATITVGPVNDGPNAVNEVFGTDEDTVLDVPDPGVLTNDTDPEGDDLTVTAFDSTSTEGATVNVNADGSFSYDPTSAPDLQALAVGESVDDTFTYTIEDPGGASDSATVTVTVDGVNDPPTATDDGGAGFTTDEDTAFTTGSVLANDTDPDATDILSVDSFVATGTLGTVTGNLDGTFNYDPNGQFEGLGADDVATDTFTYTVTDGNGGTDTATVTVTINGVNDAPLAVGETFDGAGGNFDPAIGNTTLQFAASDTVTHPHVFVAGDVLDNDTDVEGDPLTITAVDGDSLAVGNAKTLASGAVVTLDADGEFTYSPPLGFEGADSFTYTVHDGTDGSLATVTIEIAGMVWYLDEDASGGGNDGRAASPFESVAFFNAVQGGGLDSQPEAGDLIFLHDSADTYSGGIELLDQQKLYGEGVALLVGGQTLVAAGTRPELENAGDAVTVLAQDDADAGTVDDRTGIEIRGLALSSTSGNAIDVTSADSQVVEVTIADNLIDGSGTEGIDLNPDSSGAFTATIENNTFSTSSATGNAIDVVTGALSSDVEVAIDGNTDITSAATGIHLDGTLGTGKLFVTGFADNTIHGNTGGAGVMATNVTFDADPTTAAFDEVAAGTWSVGTSANPVGGAGMYLAGLPGVVEGNLAFTRLDVFAGNGAGLDVAGAGLFGGGTPGTGFQLGVAGGTVQATGGPGVTIDPATLGITFDSVTSTASPTTGISLTDVAGTFSATGGSIATAGLASGPTFQVSGGSVAASYGGSVASAVGNSVQVQNMTGGMVTLSGPVDDDGAGVSITGNDAATSVAFNGGLDLDTTVNTAFTATGDGSMTVDSAPTNTISTTTGIGVLVNGVDTAGSFDFDSVTVTNGGAAGISIQSSTGTKTFGLVNVTNSGGAGLFASSAGTVSVTNGASSIATTGQPAVDADNTTFDATFASLTSTGSASTGIDLASVGGSFTATSVTIDGTTGAGVQLIGNSATVALNGGTIGATTTTGGNAVDVDGGAAGVTIAAGIANTVARSVEVTNRSGGTVTISGAIDDTGTGINMASNSGGSTTFSNASKVLNTGTNPAVTLATNGGHTVNFTGGGLDIDTTSGAGFSATGSGTVNVTGGGNTVNTTTGTGVNIANVTIGASDVTFERVSVNGAANGIVLDTTGTTGGFTVTGNGGTCTAATPTCTGGRLQATSGADGAVAGNGVYLSNTGPVSLSFVRIDNHPNHAIFGDTVNGFSLIDSVVGGANGNNDAIDEGSIRFDDLLGSSAITRSDVSGGHEDNLRLVNETGTLDRLVITDSAFHDNSNLLGNDGILLESRSSAVMKVTVDNTTFSAHRGDHFDANATDTSTLDVIFTNNTMTGGHSNALGQTFILSNGASADVTFDVSGNGINGAVLSAFTFFQSAASTVSSSLIGTFSGNTIGTTGSAGSGSSQGHGAVINATGSGTVTVVANNNEIRQWSNEHGILVQAGDGSPTVNVTVTNSTIKEPNTASFPTNGLHLNAGTTAAGAASVCLDVQGNDMVGSNGGFGADDFRLRQRNSSTVNLPGYPGTSGDTAAVVTFVQGNNTGTPSGSAQVSGSGGGFTGTGTSCPTP